jgi:hypothetical protein
MDSSPASHERGLMSADLTLSGAAEFETHHESTKDRKHENAYLVLSVLRAFVIKRERGTS